MPGAINSIIIVGGGLSGWMTALYLNHLYNQHKQAVEISLIDSSDAGIIGAGEASLSNIRFFFAAMGLDENELIRETNATLKSGILFKHWRQPIAGEEHQFFHPCDHIKLGPGLDIATQWLLTNRKQFERFDQGSSLSAHLMLRGQSPKTDSCHPYEGVVPYGYHFDATLMFRYLRKKAIAAGVKHIETKVTDIDCHAGNIESVETEYGRHKADYYLDCTGFKGVLIERLKKENWHSLSSQLPCNRAVTMQVAYEAGEQPRTFTQATALKYGWAWQIDLVNRRGTGYVYDGERISSLQAEQELTAHIGNQVKILGCQHVELKVGHRNEFWLGNCIALGLSGGFIDPLESTGLHLVHTGVRMLASHLSSNKVSPSVRDAYNSIMVREYQALSRFIRLHYYLTDRRDTSFWRQFKAHAGDEELARLLALWRYKVCEAEDIANTGTGVFSADEYRFVLYGMQYLPQLSLAYDETQVNQVFARLDSKVQHTLDNTIAHQDFLQALHDMPLQEIASLWSK